MKTAPNFTLQDQDGQEHSLSDYAGQWLVVYFYPKDDTPGCTKEACSFRDGRDLLEERGIKVVGISGDSVASHKKFAEKFKLNFTLLADPDRKVIEAYGALGEKSMFGKKYIGILRNTYLINPQGKIVKEYTKVKPEDHAAQILRDAGALQSA
ncbi:MAG TPA: thioredoxin-dependent thiol peroxidase [Candidatus Saccharimonadales bacterium]|nr:thioredoxin-dependent thiol peroxidase [Candidatus Saccharimonadales bacterium]